MEEQTKNELMELAEGLTAETVEAVFKIAEIEIKATPNKLDDIVLLALPQVKAFVLKYVDKIDGAEGWWL